MQSIFEIACSVTACNVNKRYILTLLLDAYECQTSYLLSLAERQCAWKITLVHMQPSVVVHEVYY